MAGKHGAKWDHVEFAAKFGQLKLSKDYSGLKSQLKEVADHNYEIRSQCGTIPRTVPVSYEDCQKYERPAGPGATISFSKMDTIEALMAFGRERGRSVCGLNYANGKDVGGGYKNGSTAQEEDLCRRIPTLYSSLYKASLDGLYPFGPPTCTSKDRPEKYSDVLYTSNLWIMRADEVDGFKLLENDQCVKVSMVAAAAPNIRFAKPPEVNDADLLYRTIENIFTAPLIVEPDVNTLIVGALGCGAFGGDPVQISELFLKAIVQDNLGQSFKEIHFAIPQTSPDDQNYEIFREVFQRYKVPVKDM